MPSQVISQVCPQTLHSTSACMSMAHKRYLHLTQALDCCRILGMLHILDWDVLSTLDWEMT